jgi:hypothetical protein
MTMQWERRDGEPGIAFRVIEHTMIAAMWMRGWTRVHLFRRERCACQSYTCPYTLGHGYHITPY